MAQTFSIASGTIASIVDNSEIRNIDTDFEVLDLVPTPLPAWVNKGKPVKLGEDLLYEKIISRRLPRTVTNTANIVTAATDITFSTSDAARLQIGHLLLADIEIIRVTTVGATTVGVTKAFAGTTTTTHTTGTVMKVMSPVFADGATFQQSPTSQGEFTTFLPFIIQYEDSVTPIRTATRTYLEKNQDPRSFRKEQIKKEKMAELEMLLLHSRASTISASTAGAPAGIRQLVSTNSTSLSSGALTATAIENMLDTLYGWNGRRQITIMGNRTMHRIWNAVWRQYFDKTASPSDLPRIGQAVHVYNSPTMGDVEFMVCEACLDTELLFLTKSNWELHPLDWAYGSGWHEFERGVKETNALGFTWGMFYAGVLTVNDERLDGKLTSISTTTSDYAGYM
jgi:hypothetical protein